MTTTVTVLTALPVETDPAALVVVNGVVYVLIAVTVIGPPAVVEGWLELAVIGAPAAVVEGEGILEEAIADDDVTDAAAPEMVCDPTWDGVLDDED